MAVARYYDYDLGEWVLLAAGRDGTPGASSWDDLTGKPATFPPETHTHAEYATTAALNGKVSSAGAAATLWVGTEAQYNALPSATRNAAGFVAVILP